MKRIAEPFHIDTMGRQNAMRGGGVGAEETYLESASSARIERECRAENRPIDFHTTRSLGLGRPDVLAERLTSVKSASHFRTSREGTYKFGIKASYEGLMGKETNNFRCRRLCFRPLNAAGCLAWPATGRSERIGRKASQKYALDYWF